MSFQYQEIRLSDLQNRYGGDNPISLSEYYDGNIVSDNNIPQSGFLSMSMFTTSNAPYGKPHTCFRTNKGFHVDLNTVARWFRAQSNTAPIINESFSNFFYYGFENGSNQTINCIRDGGNDMYDTGNYITVQSSCIGLDSNEIYDRVPYGNVVTEPTHGVLVTAPYTYPHTAMVYIQDETVSLNSSGDAGSDGGGVVGNIDVFSYSTSNGGRYGQVWANINGLASDPSIVDVWYTICSSNWNSTVTSNDDGRKTIDDGNDYSHYVSVGGSNIILCKSLISLSNGNMDIGSNEIAPFLSNLVANMPISITSNNVNVDVRASVAIQSSDD